MKQEIENQKSKLYTRISRRTFLRLTLLGAIGAIGAFIYKATEPIGLDKWIRFAAQGYTAQFSSNTSRVAIAACASYDADVLDALRRVWRDANAPDLKNARVVIKPNLVDFIEGRPTFTDPRVAQAMIRLARELGAREVIVADGPAFRRDAQAILDATGYGDMLAREHVPFVDLNYDDLVTVPLKGGYTRLKKLFVARTIADADVLISLPKLKTHHWAQMSASIKNLFGTVPGIKYGWPKNTLHVQGIPAFLAELIASMPTRMCAVVDGVVGLEGDGPLYGSGVSSGVLVAGNDLVAVDATCARLIGYDPMQIDFLKLMVWSGIGIADESKIELVGEPIAKFARAYERPPKVD